MRNKKRMNEDEIPKSVLKMKKDKEKREEEEKKKKKKTKKKDNINSYSCYFNCIRYNSWRFSVFMETTYRRYVFKSKICSYRY